MPSGVQPLGTQLTDVAERLGTAPALVEDGRPVTYQQLERAANRLARSFLRCGLARGDVVTIGLPDGRDFVTACFAAWKVGAVPHPVSPHLPHREQREILELARPRLVLGLDVGAEWPSVPDLAAAGEDERALPPTVSPHWRIMTSGGSTGRPKLIRAAGDGRLAPSLALGIREHSVVHAPGPLHHTTAFVACVSALQVGGTVVLTERFSPERTVDAVEEHRVDVLLLVPTMMSRILTCLEETGRAFDTSSLQMVWHTAAACPGWLKRAWIDLVGPDRLTEVYGATELVSVTAVSGREWLDRPGTVGRPLFGEMRVCDATGAPAAPGQVGEILMRPPGGAALPFDYIGTETEVGADGWISVGDLGWMDDDGYLYVSDRRTDMLVTGGHNVFPAEVEGALEAHPDVLGAVVVGLPDRDLGHRVHAVVHVRPAADEQALREHMAQQLVRYKQPRSYHLVDELLRDDAGKVRRSAWRRAECERLGAVDTT